MPSLGGTVEALTGARRKVNIMKHTRRIYEMKSGREEISEEIYDNSIAARAERAEMEREVRDPKSHVKVFRFELVDNAYPRLHSK